MPEQVTQFLSGTTIIDLYALGQALSIYLR